MHSVHWLGLDKVRLSPRLGEVPRASVVPTFFRIRVLEIFICFAWGRLKWSLQSGHWLHESCNAYIGNESVYSYTGGVFYEIGRGRIPWSGGFAKLEFSELCTIYGTLHKFRDLKDTCHLVVRGMMYRWQESPSLFMVFTEEVKLWNWDLYLDRCILSYSATVHTYTGASPVKVFTWGQYESVWHLLICEGTPIHKARTSTPRNVLCHKKTFYNQCTQSKAYREENQVQLHTFPLFPIHTADPNSPETKVQI